MKKRTFVILGTMTILLLVVGIFVTHQVQTNKKIESYETANLELTQKLNTQEKTIDSLSTELEKANETIERQQPLVDEYKELSKFVDFDSMDLTQLEKAQEISGATPLDYESAVALVKYADIYDIPYSLVLSIIDVESKFDKNLVGMSQDRGYMQIIPVTEKYLATTYGEELGLSYDPARIFEPEYNLALGIKYLDVLMNDYGADYERILSVYNRGAGNLSKYYSAYKTYSTSYSRKVLSNETLYVALNQ